MLFCRMVSSAARRASVKVSRSPQKRKLRIPAFEVQSFLDSAGLRRKVAEFRGKETVFGQGDPAKSVMYIQEGGVKLSVVNETGKEAVVAILGPGDFFGEGCLAGQSVCMATATIIAPTTVLVICEKRDDSHAPRGTRVLRPLHRLYACAKRASRGGPDRPALQLQRETAGAHSAAARALWRARPSSKGASQSIARDAGGDDWHDAVPGQFFHEQIQETGLHPIQRRDPHQQFPPECCPARVSTNFCTYRKAAYFQIIVGNRGLPPHILDCWSEGDLSSSRIAGNSFRLNRLSRRKLPVYVWS